jgi:tetratricopeptide (TPR) repeat protein
VQNTAGQVDKLLLLLVVFLASAGAAPEDLAASAAVEGAFRAALDAAPWSPEQVRLLEQVAKEGPETQWADDALWVLGEMARQAGDQKRAIYYWQYLTALRPNVVLEEDTKSLDVYARSGIPQVELYLQLTARRYVRVEATGTEDGQRYMEVRPVSATAMLICQGLGEAYEALGKRGLALRAYRHALANCPEAGSWRERFQEAVRRLADAEPPAAAPADAAPGPSAAGPLTGKPVEEVAGAAEAALP